ncbi:hypothetical protein [Paraburkholderia sp. SIMBA_030]|uniref:hypothetical protein n=1 Tax=Paraburkholderia sp. SIMBA_030 TaxID=3085773 RepID=UPI00397B455C
MWLRLYRKIAGGVAQRLLARGLRGNLTQAAESWMKPDCALFERNPRWRRLARRDRACVLAYFLEKWVDAR